MNQLLLVILLINLGFIMYELGPLGFFVTMLLATAAYYFLNKQGYVKKTWPLKIAYLIIMSVGVVTVHIAFKMPFLTFAIGTIETISFFIFSNIQRF